MAVLNKRRIEGEGKKPQIVYRRIYEVPVLGTPYSPEEKGNLVVPKKSGEFELRCFLLEKPYAHILR